MDKKGRGASRRSIIAGAAAAMAAGLAGRGVAAVPATGGQQEAKTAAMPSDGRKVAVMMDDVATMIDFAGPWEVFQDVMVTDAPHYHLFTVAPKAATYNTTGNLFAEGGKHRMSGLKFVSDFGFDDCPQPDVIVMGAQMGFDTPEKLEWLRHAAVGAETILAVCTGNFIAAHAGLLDGLQATTHHGYFEKFEKKFPKVHLVREQRVVDNGKIISAGGLTSGIDGALHVVRKHHGDEVVQKVVEYMEYRNSGWKG